jgi:hypothetical protein
MAYGFSVFWLPMSRLVAGADMAACANQTFVAELFTTTCNWSVPAVTHIFEVFIAVLGISAAVWGGWLEHAGPRKDAARKRAKKMVDGHDVELCCGSMLAGSQNLNTGPNS